MAITALPTPPLRSDPTNFAARGDAFLSALPTFVTEANATAAAMNLNSTTDTSASSVLISTGAKTFVVSAGKSFQPGMYLVIADAAAPSTNSVFGQVTSYSGTSLVMNILTVRGSGTYASWVISQASAGGAQAGANSDITSLTNLTGGALVNGAAGLGYGAGAGGTVTQATSKSTAVTLNKPTGTITVNGAALAAGATAQFILNNTFIASQDIVLVSQYGFSTNTGAYQYWVNASGLGQAIVNVKNLTAGSLSDSMTLQFSIVKGAIA